MSTNSLLEASLIVTIAVSIVANADWWAAAALHVIRALLQPRVEVVGLRGRLRGLAQELGAVIVEAGDDAADAVRAVLQLLVVVRHDLLDRGNLFLSFHQEPAEPFVQNRHQPRGRLRDHGLDCFHGQRHC